MRNGVGLTGARLLALDMDGTLLRSDLTISERNRAAVAACLSLGVHVVLATGRIYSSVTPYAALWPGQPIWVAAGNGASIRRADGGAPIRERLIGLPAAREVAAWAQGNGLYLKIYVDDHLYVYEVTEETIRFHREHGVPYTRVDDLAASLPEAPSKMVVGAPPERIPAVEAEIRGGWGDRLEITGSTPDSVEMTAPGATKGDALRFLAGHLGVDRAGVAAIGNERNDSSMVTWAGCGAVVANAAEAVKALAPRVVAANDEDGVAQFIAQWLALPL